MKMPSQFFKIFSLTLGLFCAVPAAANNISITNTTLADQDTGADTYDIEFDISWDNSWHVPDSLLEPGYWDAAWVFAKYSVYNQASATWGPWQHCELLNTGSVAPAGSQIDFGDTDGAYVGAFIYRGSAGSGTNTWTDAQLRWHYGADSVADNAIVRVKVFGIEMVYVPEGAFYVGDGTADANGFYEGGGTSPFQITSEAAITVANSAGNLYYNEDNAFGGDRLGPIPAAFPKGYAAFYLMKYEMTQQQYVDFLNTLTRTQQNARTQSQAPSRYTMSDTASPDRRNGIRNPAVIPVDEITFGCDANNNGVFNESNDGQTRAVNHLRFSDFGAYAAWAGLRPFTELEFEKAARGPLDPLPNEYAWGTATIAGSAYTLSNSGANNESIATNYSTTAGNASYDTTDGAINGPLRSGIFAAHGSNSGRVSAGAGYYGAMELSGNLFERIVSVGSAAGRNFTGSHGSGTLEASGSASNTDWPLTGNGAGFRGAGWGDSAWKLGISMRDAAASSWSAFDIHAGARAARTAP